jgi:hypothetical protein
MVAALVYFQSTPVVTHALFMTNDICERREKPRACIEIPVEIRGRDQRGSRICIKSVAENISSNGILVRTKSLIPNGARLFLVMRFVDTESTCKESLRVATRATVVRVEKRPLGTYSIAAAFSHHRFL